MSELGKTRELLAAASLGVAVAIGVSACTAEQGGDVDPPIVTTTPDKSDGPEVQETPGCIEQFSAYLPAAGVRMSWLSYTGESAVIQTADADLSAELDGQSYPEPIWPDEIVRPRSAALVGEQGEEAKAAAWRSMKKAIDCVRTETGKPRTVWAREFYAEGGGGLTEQQALARANTIAVETESRFGLPIDERNGGSSSVAPKASPVQLVFLSATEASPTSPAPEDRA